MSVNKDIINSFWEERAAMSGAAASRWSDDNRVFYDLSLIKKFIDSSSNVLDLGCGGCIITNELEPFVNSILAVDKYSGFFKFRKDSPKIETMISDITDFRCEKKFDVILIFGVLNYVSREQAKSVYERCFEMLTNKGVLIVKHQMGLNEDIVVESFSEELNQQYCAVYRNREQEKKDMENAGFTLEIVDIYPKSFNKWENTHHYAFVCKK